MDKPYWFPAKRYGIGWGLPCTWQGWLVLLVYCGSFAAGAFLFPAHTDRGPFILAGIGLTVLLLIVMYLKGEPLRWRWGKEGNSSH